jgi:hypothetical protein
MAQGALTAAALARRWSPPLIRALQAQVSELQLLLGTKTMQAEPLREAVSRRHSEGMMGCSTASVASPGLIPL